MNRRLLTCLLVILWLGVHAQTPDPSLMWKLTKEDPIPQQLSWLEMRLEPFVFKTPQFPKADFEQADLVRKALGSYEISVVYYNSEFQQVETAEKPGRYGAVVNVRFTSGVTMNRYYTLFRYPGNYTEVQWWQWASRNKNNVNIDMPGILGIDPAVSKSNADAINMYVRFGFYEDLKKRPYAARLLAGLYDESQYMQSINNIKQEKNHGVKKAGVAYNTDINFKKVLKSMLDNPAPSSLIVKNARIMELDRQWWVTLKEKLQPSPVSLIARDFKGPEITEKPVGRVLRTTTPADAGMSANVNTQIDKSLNSWMHNSDQAFSVLLARNGKVFYQKAYGARDNKAMTLNTRSHIASVNKTFTGILLTMCIDKGYLSLDDEISKFFPSLKDAKWSKPITIRHLVSHTSGLPDLAIDEQNDVEEVIKPFLPYINPGEQYGYCETGYTLCGKIMEVITGKSFSTLLREWLLVPMQLNNTEVYGAASDGYNTPGDIGKIGQLILNGGSYGNVRYFSQNTFKTLMMPGEKNQQVGIGLFTTLATDATAGCGKSAEDAPVESTAELNRVYTPAQLTKIAREKSLNYGFLIGHPASSGTLFAIDMDNGLVMVMTRNKRGDNFQEHHTEFMKTIIKGVPHPVSLYNNDMAIGR